MRPIDGDALEKDLRESHDKLREIYNGLKYDDDRQICAGQLTTFTEAILRIKDAPTIEPYGTWIPCSERLPEEIQMFERGDDVTPVIVTFLSYYEKEPMCTILAIYCEDGKWRWYDDNGYVSQMETVKVPIIAWMPLPEPYGEE